MLTNLNQTDLYKEPKSSTNYENYNEFIQGFFNFLEYRIQNNHAVNTLHAGFRALVRSTALGIEAVHYKHSQKEDLETAVIAKDSVVAALEIVLFAATLLAQENTEYFFWFCRAFESGSTIWSLKDIAKDTNQLLIEKALLSSATANGEDENDRSLHRYGLKLDNDRLNLKQTELTVNSAALAFSFAAIVLKIMNHSQKDESNYLERTDEIITYLLWALTMLPMLKVFYAKLPKSLSTWKTHSHSHNNEHYVSLESITIESNPLSLPSSDMLSSDPNTVRPLHLGDNDSDTYSSDSYGADIPELNEHLLAA